MNTELLSPAGSLKSLRYAIAYGADAIYAGLPRYSLRARNNEFDLDTLARGIELAHRAGKRLYVTANIFAHNAKVASFIDDLAEVVVLRPDALILADPGLLHLARERWPDLPLHLSVQANTVNYAAVRFWQQVGVKRIILSRELALDEIEAIRQACPDIELEVFVHGALCIAYSGRCLLSGYFSNREANQGVCSNACRWEYRLDQSHTDGRHPQADHEYRMEESERPGELLSIAEDEHGTYIMNSKDLRAVAHVQRLVSMGIDSLKIEGRTKSHYYVARTAQIYRQAIDAALSGAPYEERWGRALEGLANRGYTDGFLRRHGAAAAQNYVHNASESKQQLFVGEVVAAGSELGWATVESKNRFQVGDRLEMISSHGNEMVTLEQILDENGNQLLEVPGSGCRVQIPWPEGDSEFGLIARELPTK